MKTSAISKIILVVIFLLSCFKVEAQNIVSDTIKVSAGNLNVLLGDKKDLITNLTLKGKINGTDITTIRSMAKLTVLDISKASIVKGGVFISSLYDDKIDVSNDEVPEEAFYAKDNLKTIILPENITAIGLKAFSDCISLTAIIIPEGVTTIGTNAFYGCSKLTILSLPASITLIDYGAFQECAGLKEIHCKATVPPKITPFTFYGVPRSTCKLYVPTGIAAQAKTVAGWNEFKIILEE